MADRVFLHVGTPKSGTTYLQDLLWTNRESLGRHGVVYPGWAPEAHFLACTDLLDLPFNDWSDPASVGAWERLAEEVARAEGTVVISHELFGDADPETARRAITTFAPAEVHVVVTARDLARQLPAVWQEDLKNRHSMSFDQFLDAADPAKDVEEWWGETFWHRQDVPAVLRRWTSTLPPERVHVVTVPPSGGPRETLWQRFAGVIGAEDVEVVTPDSALNSSLGSVEAEVLRRVNALLDCSVEWPVYAARVSRGLVPEVLARRAGTPRRLPTADRVWVAERAQLLVADLAASGYQVVGDLDELLVPVSDHRPADRYTPPAEAEVLELAVEALAWLVSQELPTAPPVPAPAPEPEPVPVPVPVPVPELVPAPQPELVPAPQPEVVLVPGPRTEWAPAPDGVPVMARRAGLRRRLARLLGPEGVQVPVGGPARH